VSRPALDDLVAGVELRDSAIALIDYNAMARRLTLRFRPADAEGSDIVTLIFDAVVGLYCQPQDALRRLDDEEGATIDRLDAKRRKTGEVEITLVYLRGSGGAACTVSFMALEARWFG